MLLTNSRSADRSRVARALDDLAYVCTDGADGYTLAADLATSPVLQERLRAAAAERAGFAAELRREVEHLEGYPSDGGTLLAILHRQVLALVHGPATSAEPAILAACITGDEHALRAYEHALASVAWPGHGSAHALVTYQRDAIHRMLRGLRDDRGGDSS